MAKWGEGDPRWIVEERPDATNVNNWHWTEKNASNWSKSTLETLLVGLVIDDPKVGRAEITKIEKCSGEASANNRKGKLIFFYEWILKLAWKGNLNGSDKSHEGFIRIPNLSDENEASDLDISASVTAADGSDKMLAVVRSEGCELVRTKLAEYVTALKKEFASDMILPSKNGDQKPAQSKTIVSKPQQLGSGNNVDDMSKLALDAKITTSTFSETQQFKCTADELFNTLTVPYMVEAFTRSSCKMVAEKDGAFEMLGGNISGHFEELVRPTRLVMRWRLKNWPVGHFSRVTVELQQKDDCTDLRLTQTDIPACSLEATGQGWRRYYWDAMRQTFGYGAPLL